MDYPLLLRFAIEHDASDVHLQAGLRPNLRVGGILRSTDQPPLTDESVRAFIQSIAPPRLQGDLDEHLSRGMDFSYAPAGLTRFRCSAYRQLGQAGIAMRIIKSRIASVAELNLPPVINEIAQTQRGLTLVTGTTG